MNTETQTKIDRLKNLFADRDAIDEQIIAIINGGTLPAEKPTEKKIEKKKYKKHVKVDGFKFEEFKGKGKHNKPQTCSNCGEVGHRKDHCPKDVKETANEPESEDSTPMSVKQAVENGALDRMQYSMVRERKHQEMTADEVADAMDFDSDEVKLAFSSQTYPGYLLLR